MRVIGGSLGGRTLAAPRGRATRPTSDRVREAVFSILGDMSGLAVLDLYAGSGALAIEALSRGAAQATLVDCAPTAIATTTLTEELFPYTAGRSGIPIAAAFGNARVNESTALSAAVSLPKVRAKKYIKA